MQPIRQKYFFLAMLDRFVIFTKGGLVLFSKDFVSLKFNAVNTLVSDVLIEERAGKSSYISKEYAMKWTMLNELDIIFVAVYQKLFQLAYVDDFLAAIKNVFKRIYKKNGSSFLYSLFFCCFSLFIHLFPSSSFTANHIYLLLSFPFLYSSFIDNGVPEFSESFDKTLNHFETIGQKSKTPSAKHHTPKEKHTMAKLEAVIEGEPEKKQEPMPTESTTTNNKNENVAVGDDEKSDSESTASSSLSPEPITAEEQEHKTADEIQFEKLQKASIFVSSDILKPFSFLSL